MKKQIIFLSIFFLSTSIFFAHAEVSICPNTDDKKYMQRLDKINRLHQDILIYMKAGKNPMDASLPLGKKIAKWSDTAEHLSMQEKQELVDDAIFKNEVATEKMFDLWIVKSEAINGCRAFEAVLCPLIGEKSFTYKQLHKKNRERCNKIWLGLAIPSVED